MPAKSEISLLPAEEDVNSFSGRFIKWLTTVGRFVIVFTELIVIGAFLSRFWLDRKNSDLSEVIRQQKAILQSTSNFEKDFALVQQKLKFIKGFYAINPNYSQKIDTLITSTPGDVYYETFSLQEPTTEIPGGSGTVSLIAYKEESIVGYISNLILNPNIQSVDVKSIEKKAKDSKYYLNIYLTFKKNLPNG